MNVHDYRAVEQLDRSSVEQVEQVEPKDDSHVDKQASAANEQAKNTNEAPPITGSKQWKALYEAISNYAKEIKGNRDSNI